MVNGEDERAPPLKFANSGLGPSDTCLAVTAQPTPDTWHTYKWLIAPIEAKPRPEIAMCRLGSIFVIMRALDQVQLR